MTFEPAASAAVIGAVISSIFVAGMSWGVTSTRLASVTSRLISIEQKLDAAAAVQITLGRVEERLAALERDGHRRISQPARGEPE